MHFGAKSKSERFWKNLEGTQKQIWKALGLLEIKRQVSRQKKCTLLLGHENAKPSNPHGVFKWGGTQKWGALPMPPPRLPPPLFLAVI